MVNPDVGREYLLNARLTNGNRSKKPARVLVAGAGPAGMAAARQFALVGHEVSLCEQGPASGGLLGLAAKAPGRGELGDILAFFRRELVRLTVPVRYAKILEKGSSARFHLIGDAKSPRHLMYCISEAEELALSL